VHFVELYCWCHAKVYGVQPAELELKDSLTEAGKRERVAAVSAARALIVNAFGGDVVEAVAYVQWAWGREQEREDWARKNGKTRGRLAWRALFSGRGILGDYRVEQARVRRGAK
jgi:hypothetical protein